MPKRAGFIHLLPLLLIAVLLTAAFYLIATGAIETPLTKKASPLEPQRTYKNPFSKETQYVNPFSEYKNPFGSLKQ